MQDLYILPLNLCLTYIHMYRNITIYGIRIIIVTNKINYFEFEFEFLDTFLVPPATPLSPFPFNLFSKYFSYSSPNAALS